MIRLFYCSLFLIFFNPVKSLKLFARVNTLFISKISKRIEDTIHYFPLEKKAFSCFCNERLIPCLSIFYYLYKLLQKKRKVPEKYLPVESH